MRPRDDLAEAVAEGVTELEDLGGFCYVDPEQFIRDVRQLLTERRTHQEDGR